MPERRSLSLAVWLALAMAALVAYASLYPFSGWRWPPGQEFPQALELPWPRWRDGFDEVANILGYLPLGLLIYIGVVRSGGSRAQALLSGVVLAALLSLTMEELQQFLPRRVPSLKDLAGNVAGAALGVALGWVLHTLGAIGRWDHWRRRWLAADAAGGLLLLLLWPLGLLFPAPLPFSLGQGWEELARLLRGAYAGAPWAHWLGGMSPRAPLPEGLESLAVGLALLAPSLLALVLLRPGVRRLAAVGLVPLAGFGAMTLSTVLNFGPAHATTWLTPPAKVGIGVAMAAALPLALLPRRVCAGLCLLALATAVALVAQAPEDPYYAASLQAWEQGQFIRFHGLAQWIGWAWPYLVMGWILWLLAASGADRRT